MQATDTFPLPITDDARLLAGLRARDTAGFTEVYAAYGARLYDYAMWMVGDESVAEDAVLDAFLVAVDRADKLAATDQFGIWLYALTRNECLRQLRRTTKAVALRPDNPPVVADDLAALAGRQVPARDPQVFDSAAAFRSRRDGPAWAWDAVATLDPRGREALDLALRHALSPDQLAQVLGLSTRRATALVVAGREQLQRASVEIRTADPMLGVCGELRALLTGRDAVPPAIADMIGIHRAICAACSAARRGEAHAAQLFATLPALPVPPALHPSAMRAATVPSRVSARGEMAEPFRRSGFPVPLDRGGGRGRAVAKSVLASAAAVVVLGAGGWIALRPALQDPEPPKQVVGSARTSVSSAPSSPITSVSATLAPSWRPVPSPTISTPPPSESPAPGPGPSRTIPAPTGTGGTGRPAQLDALLADTTIGCPPTWRARVTVFIRFNVADTVTLTWGETQDPTREIAMRRLTSGIYEADATGLPLSRPVYWRVTAITVDGYRTATPVNMFRHIDLCPRSLRHPLSVAP